MSQGHAAQHHQTSIKSLTQYLTFFSLYLFLLTECPDLETYHTSHCLSCHQPSTWQEQPCLYLITHKERVSYPAFFWYAHRDLGPPLPSFVTDFALLAIPAVPQTFSAPDISTSKWSNLRLTGKNPESVGTPLTKKLWRLRAIRSCTHSSQARSYRYTVHIVGEVPSIQARCFPFRIEQFPSTSTNPKKETSRTQRKPRIPLPQSYQALNGTSYLRKKSSADYLLLSSGVSAKRRSNSDWSSTENIHPLLLPPIGSNRSSAISSKGSDLSFSWASYSFSSVGSHLETLLHKRTSL